MDTLTILLQLAGATMLLLYSVRMVGTGVERASGPSLRRFIANPDRNRLVDAAAGLSVAVLLQSSTATSVLATGFAANGLVTQTGGLALLLGADVGTALVVQILSFDLKWLIPLLLAFGGWLFLKFESRRVRQCGRIGLGIAFILIALHMIGEATAPLKDGSIMPVLASYLSKDVITAFLVGAAITFLIHSSVASVLMIAAFTAQGVLPIQAGIPLLLGANVGSGLIGVWLTRGMPQEARRLPLGNLVFRAVGALAALALFRLVDVSVVNLGAGPARQLVNLHLLFNLALFMVCVFLTGPMARLTASLLPKPLTAEEGMDRLRPSSALDRNVIGTPGLALASVTRELLRMCELLDVMIRPMMDFFEKASDRELAEIRKLGKQVNAVHTGIKLYVAEVNRGKLSSQEAERGMELTGFAINLDRASDMVVRNLLDLVEEKHEKNIRFSREGWRELTDLHARVMANIQLSMNVLVSEDLDSARQLRSEKDRMRTLEKRSHERHLVRLRKGSMESIESSDIHLETVRALKEINTLFASVAVPILSRSGQLLDSRLVDMG